MTPHLSAAEAWFKEHSHGESHTVSSLILHGPAGGILFIVPNLKAAKTLELANIDHTAHLSGSMASSRLAVRKEPHSGRE